MRHFSINHKNFSLFLRFIRQCLGLKAFNSFATVSRCIDFRGNRSTDREPMYRRLINKVSFFFIINHTHKLDQSKLVFSETTLLSITCYQ